MWPDESETCDLLNRARQGDAGAAEELLRRHRLQLRRAIELLRIRLDRNAPASLLRRGAVRRQRKQQYQDSGGGFHVP